jgi:hypothetical protein
MISNENHFINRWMTKTTNPFHNRTVTFLQLYKKWLQYHNWSFCPCELKQEALYVLLICYLPSIQVIYDMCISDMISTFMTSVFLRHDINIYKISVFQTRHVHLRHQRFSDTTCTFKTSVFFSIQYTWSN